MCTNCNKIFNKKSNFDKHINNKKRPCGTVIIKGSPNEAPSSHWELNSSY